MNESQNTENTSEQETQNSPLFQETDQENNSTEENKDPFQIYFNSLSEEDKEVFVKNGVKDAKTHHSSYKGLLELKGRKGLIKPSETASDEDKQSYKQALYKEIGVPENGEYEYSTPEGVDNNFIEEDFINKLAEVAHTKGISSEGFQAVIDTIYPAYQEEVTAYQNEINALKAKLGEGTMNPAPQAQVNSESQDDIADKIMDEAIAAFGKNDTTTYQKKMKAYYSIRGM